MSFAQIAGKLLQGLGPGMARQAGQILDPKDDDTPKPPDPKKPETAQPNSFKDGGVVQKTGVALVHKGETVMPNSPGSDLASTLKSTPSRVADTLTLGPQRRELSDWVGKKEQQAKDWLTTPIGSSSSKPKEPAAPTGPHAAAPNHYKHGGVVQKTGLALVHEGETVIPAHKDTVHLSHHRVVMHLHKGGLHRALGIPEDQKIPKERLAEARNSKNPHVREMANLAHTMEGWKH